MRKTIACLAVGLLTAGAQADFVEDFDAFTVEDPLTAQQGWEANAGVKVSTTTTSGLYTGGKALESTSYTDKTFRNDTSSADFDLTKNNADGYEFGYDIRSDATSAINNRMYMRRANLARYSPSAGFLNGKMTLRPLGEGGSNVYGNDFASAAFYGAGTAEDPGYWEKGDWLRIQITLNGTDNEMVTVKAFNLDRGNLEIPTGFTNVDMTSTAAYIDGYWNRFNFRNGTSGVLVDNAYVKAIPEPLTLSLLGGSSLLVLAARRFFLI